MNGFSPNLDCFLQKNDVFAVKQLKIMLKKTSEKRCLESCEHLFALFFEWFLPCFCVGFTCGGASKSMFIGCRASVVCYRLYC